MRYARLNQDATWWAHLGPAAVVFDPWLVGTEVDGWPWFHEAWHTGPLATLAEVPAHEVVVVSQPFADHCHLPTLEQWRPEVPLAMVPQAASDAPPGRVVHVIPAWPDAVDVAGLRISRLTRPWYDPPRYHAVVVEAPGTGAVIHAPHGLPAAIGRQVAARSGPVHILATTRQLYRLPRMLGGAVNPGPQAADALLLSTGARVALVIHDEDKGSRGLVPRLARVHRVPLHGAPRAERWRDPFDLRTHVVE